MTIKLTPKQKEIAQLLTGPQRYTLVIGGARSGKTFLLCYFILIRALKSNNSRHVIFRFRANSVWSAIGLDTMPKVARLLGIPLQTDKLNRVFKLPNGSEIWLGGLDDKERVEKILGQEFATIYFNEASQIPYSSYLVAITRLAQVCDGIIQRAYVDLNPSGKRHWTRKLFVDGIDPSDKTGQKKVVDHEDYVWGQLNPTDNAQNLSASYLKSLAGLPERQRQRFLEGRYQDEVDSALWTLEMLDRVRLEPTAPLPNFVRVVVAVDPSGAKGKDDIRSDEIGICVAAKGSDGRAYILADRSQRLGPEGWARVAVHAYHEFSADAIIGETNYGKAMVQYTIATVDPNIPFREVTASRGKAVRAEPVSVLYSEERDLVRHVGKFPELEEQLSNFSSAGYLGDRSPDRADALVWALTELMVKEAAPSFVFG